MSPEEKQELIHAVIDIIFNQQDLDRLEEFFTEDFHNHDGYPGAPTGPALSSLTSWQELSNEARRSMPKSSDTG